MVMRALRRLASTMLPRPSSGHRDVVEEVGSSSSAHIGTKSAEGQIDGGLEVMELGGNDRLVAGAPRVADAMPAVVCRSAYPT